MPSKIFVTGGTSFIGGHVVSALLKANHNVTLLAPHPAKTEGFKKLGPLSVINGSMSDFDLINENLSGCDIVINIAHVPGDGGAGKLLADAYPTVRLLEMAIANKVSQFIYTSSTSAYGRLTEIMDEERLLEPNAYWCANKAAIEKFVLAASYESSMRCNIIRPGLTFGRSAVSTTPTEAFSKFRDIVAAVCAHQPIHVVPSDGTQMTYAGDVAKVYVALITAGTNRMIYNAVSEERTTWEEFANKAIDMIGSPSRVVVDTTKPEAFPCRYGWKNIEEDLGLHFSPWPALENHIQYILDNL